MKKQTSLFNKPTSKKETKEFEKKFSIDRFAAGDERILSGLYRHYAPFLYYKALNILKDLNTAAAEDAVQKSFVAVWDHRHEFEHIGSIKAYLYTVTRNNCLNDYRQASSRSKHRNNLRTAFIESGQVVTPQQKLENKTSIDDVHKQLYNLSDKVQAAVNLRAMGYKYSEIADITGHKENTVKSQIHYARKVLTNPLTA